MTGSELLAEEMVKETFVAAFTAMPEADRRAIDCSLMRQLNSQFSLADIETEAPISARAGIRLRNMRRTDLEEALQQLPAAERLIFLLRDVEGYSPDEISELANIQQMQVNRTLFSARMRLRSILAES
jgi:RNA polymerase sigma-70 factor (ECF subfamily)